ncbi:Serine/threonine-protein kinase ulk3, partial [Podochytrium sp. JEL0797]
METIKHLGHGTTGRVRLCRILADSPLSNTLSAGTLVAVKSIPLNLLQESKRHEDRLFNEISVLRSLNHLNIVALLDVTWDRAAVSLVMEFCNMGTLKTFLARQTGGKLNEVDARFFFRQMANGLEYLWRQSLMHRDLKTENLLLMGDASQKTLPILKIADFGLSNFTCDSATETFTERIGTLQYMAPEILSHLQYDARCDLWSMGIVFFELLVGAPPFSAAKSTDTLLALIISPTPSSIDIPPPISSHISAEACTLISSLLTKSPDKRIHFPNVWSSPYLDLKHTPSPQSLPKANAFLHEAISLDESMGTPITPTTTTTAAPSPNSNTFHNRLHEIRKLVDMYLEAIDYLFAHVQFLTDRAGGESRRAKERIGMCLERVETRKNEAAGIRVWLDEHGSRGVGSSEWVRGLFRLEKEFVGDKDDSVDDDRSGMRLKLPFEKATPYKSELIEARSSTTTASPPPRLIGSLSFTCTPRSLGPSAHSNAEVVCGTGKRCFPDSQPDTPYPQHRLPILALFVFLWLFLLYESWSKTPPLSDRITPSPGIAVTLLSEGLDGARSLLVDPTGRILVVATTLRSIVRIDPQTGQKAPLLDWTGLQLNHGIALIQNNTMLLASSADTVYAWSYPESGAIDIEERMVLVSQINGDSRGKFGHETRSLSFEETTGYLYVSIGSLSNVDRDSNAARIVRFKIVDESGDITTPDEETGFDFVQDGEVWADGLRNSVAQAWDPMGRLWESNNGPDQLSRTDLNPNKPSDVDFHNDSPVEEVNLLDTQGAFYGYPFCFTAGNVSSSFDSDSLRGTQFAWEAGGIDGIRDDVWCRNTSNNK